MLAFLWCALLLSWAFVHCDSNCSLSNITLTLEKEECGICVNVNTTWCSGYCFTKDPVFKNPLVSHIQHTCIFKEIVYETIKIPGCPSATDSFYTYPVAVSCHCGTCHTETTDCTVGGLGPSYCSLKQETE
uniref:Follitropin subunit beta n=1 Tax=Neoceratodus forsteri TaxID=7892 RepID=Q70JA3_NEOFS|nr:follicle-stimulating hormone beta subunit [Neoceratodus forsteri]